jgi:hypothetical protein
MPWSEHCLSVRDGDSYLGHIAQVAPHAANRGNHDAHEARRASNHDRDVTKVTGTDEHRQAQFTPRHHHSLNRTGRTTMSTLVITDLHQVEEFSSAQMRQVDGGMGCLGEQSRMMGFYFDLYSTYNNIGATDAANAMEDKGLDWAGKTCPN